MPYDIEVGIKHYFYGLLTLLILNITMHVDDLDRVSKSIMANIAGRLFDVAGCGYAQN